MTFNFFLSVLPVSVKNNIYKGITKILKHPKYPWVYNKLNTKLNF